MSKKLSLLLIGCLFAAACGDDNSGSGGSSGSGGVSGSGGSGGSGTGGSGGSGTGGVGGSGTGGTGGSGTGGTGGTGGSGGGRTVFLILMENHNWDDIQGKSNAPYINSLLVSPGNAHVSYAKNYSNPAGVHPSEPNYVFIEAGSNMGLDAPGGGSINFTTDDPPSATHTTTSTDHLVTLLKNAGISWKSWQEDITAGSCPTAAVAKYAPKHNPPIFFSDVTSDTAYCSSHIRPYSEFAAALQNNTVARYNFITPNLCNDMHDSCAPQNDNIKQGDDWLAANVPMIMASQAYQQNGIIIITWDESELSASCPSLTPMCPIGFIVISPLAKGNGYNNMTAYTHASLTKTLQEIYGLTPLLRHAGDAATSDVSDLFATFP